MTYHLDEGGIRPSCGRIAPMHPIIDPETLGRPAGKRRCRRCDWRRCAHGPGRQGV